MKYLKIRIASGNADSLFDIFYDSPTGVGTALLYDTGLPAEGIPYDTLIIGEGITVSVPDNATSIVLDSSPSAFCTTTDGINDPMYTIPIGCMSYTVSASMGSSDYYYTDCDCIPITATIDATYGYTEQTFCALQDTVNAGLLTVVDNGDCITPPTDVYIGACGPDQYDGLGVYPVILYGDTSISPVGGNPIPIDSFLIVIISLYNGSTLIETISRNIPYPGPGGVGFTCYTVYGYGGSPSQVVDGIVVESVTPSSGAGQNYIPGDGATSSSCPSCATFYSYTITSDSYLTRSEACDAINGGGGGSGSFETVFANTDDPISSSLTMFYENSSLTIPFSATTAGYYGYENGLAHTVRINTSGIFTSTKEACPI
jgi:hypothetical protein